ncbi:helix-turn-helix domain-containing protein [Parafrankia elaeagni]|uniref:helix-turn-helix domain-containing protein n=1 Tax=Parafrankia elaeagni TaxID=222534 RepID=UPI0003674707|nr:helix-turn-helix transcriptional regulator [Parafrankia elaeagni]
MAGAVEPAIQRRRLRTELRRARQSAGLTQRDAAQSLDWSPSKVIRIESGAVGITPVDLRALLTLYGVADKERTEQLVEMARSSRRPGWSSYRSVLSREFLLYLDYESSAAAIRQAEPLLVPGLLQIEEYARAILLQAYQTEPSGVDQRWEVREERQELFERDPRPEMTFVLDEAALRRWVGGAGVMRRQLAHLRSLAESGAADIRYLPFRIGAHQCMRGPFTVLEFQDADDDDVLYLENARGDVFQRDDPEFTAPYKETFIELQDIAVGGTEFIGALDQMIGEMSGGDR